jgi:hypothetical protein
VLASCGRWAASDERRRSLNDRERLGTIKLGLRSYGVSRGRGGRQDEEAVDGHPQQRRVRRRGAAQADTSGGTSARRGWRTPQAPASGCSSRAWGRGRPVDGEAVLEVRGAVRCSVRCGAVLSSSRSGAMLAQPYPTRRPTTCCTPIHGTTCCTPLDGPPRLGAHAHQRPAPWALLAGCHSRARASCAGMKRASCRRSSRRTCASSASCTTQWRRSRRWAMVGRAPAAGVGTSQGGHITHGSWAMLPWQRPRACEAWE